MFNFIILQYCKFHKKPLLTMLNRIQRVIDYYKLTSSAFADKIGVPRSTISHILSGRNNPSLDFVTKTLDSFPQVNTDWLIKGTGPMLKVSTSLFPDEDFDDVVNEMPSTHQEPDELTQKEVIPSNAESLLEFDVKTEESQPLSQAAEEKTPDYSNMVRSEDRAEYVVNPKLSKSKASKVIVLYGDGTFIEFNPR